ncbi:MAG: DUF493 family protein [Cyclobacteriaceae bacterium]
MSWDIESFREKVESEHTFPGVYIFKFIVPSEKKDEILELLPHGKTSMRSSSNNHYVSITCRAELSSSQDVIEVYFEANKVEGTIAL